jgi:predicted AlkP superfamily pyrophosphatase or phosphodiesterase
MDQTFGRLISGLEDSYLLKSTNIILVSDHGMSSLFDNHSIYLGDYIDMNLIDLNKSVFSSVSNIEPKSLQDVI